MSDLNPQHTFSLKSESYAKSRPYYPESLYKWILGHEASRSTAWDCATGTGQAARALADYYDVIYATDISEEQLIHAQPHPKIHYSNQPAEQTSFHENTFDLVVAAQALHWFDFNIFWDEVRRVAKKGAFFCAWGYSWFSCYEIVEKTLVLPFRKLIEPFWSAKNRILWRGYDSLEIGFPFQRLQSPVIAIQQHWTLAELVDYMKTWSAYKIAIKNQLISLAIDNLISESMDLIGADTTVDLHMPLSIVAGQINKV